MSLGGGLLEHPANEALREALATGALDGLGYYRELLRLVYRLIFVLVSEDRGLLHDPDAPRLSRERYQRRYSAARLRRRAELRGRAERDDAWRTLRRVMDGLHGGDDRLALPALGSWLWSLSAVAHLHRCELANEHLFLAVRSLCWTDEGDLRRPVDWRSLAPEELGTVYESLMALHPWLHREAGRFELRTAPGNERKTSGSYYTPPSLVECLLQSALDPRLDEAASSKDPERAILALTVCDPACGSGHFLVAAARRMAQRLAVVRSGSEAPEALRSALRDVVGRCLYGVDKNPMAVELCKVSLWLEAREPARAMASLGERVRCGNALLGAAPGLMAEGPGGPAGRHDAWSRADGWCAALAQGSGPDASREVEELARRCQFFHWHLAFPEVFEGEGRGGGFDVVVGNPPWERIKLQEKEWFATRAPQIASATSAGERARRIRELATTDPALWREWTEASRVAAGETAFIRRSARFPLCARGDVNTYALFAELMRSLLGARGRAGCVVPTGLITDLTTRGYFEAVMSARQLVSAFDFENRGGLFPHVDERYRFSLVTVSRGSITEATRFVFFARHPREVDEPGRVIALSPEDIDRINPNSRTCPILRSERDAVLTRAVYRRVPVWKREGATTPEAWDPSLSRMYDMSLDGELMRQGRHATTDGEYLPVIEGKMVDMYDHRASDIVIRPGNALRQQQREDVSEAEHLDPWREARPFLAAPAGETRARTPAGWDRGWFLTLKRVTSATNWRTAVSCVVPWGAVSYTLYIVTVSARWAHRAPCLLANLNAFVADYFIRQKTTQPSLPIGALHESPVLPPGVYDLPCPWSPGQTLASWILPRVLELTYTAWALRPFARDCGDEGPPFVWEPTRRFEIRCELDAAFFILYGLSRGDAEHVLDSFRTFARYDLRAHGEPRTRRVVLERYDEMRRCMDAGGEHPSAIGSPARGFSRMFRAPSRRAGRHPPLRDT